MRMDPKILKSVTKPTRRNPIARVLKSAASPYKSKVEKVDKGEPVICPDCKGSKVEYMVCDQGHYGAKEPCSTCDGEGEVWE
jgi:DnaJ-class molecular chaperone